jgi:hypothetical protein
MEKIVVYLMVGFFVLILNTNVGMELEKEKANLHKLKYSIIENSRIENNSPNPPLIDGPISGSIHNRYYLFILTIRSRLW